MFTNASSLAATLLYLVNDGSARFDMKRKVITHGKVKIFLGFSLKCFSDLAGLEVAMCEERKGFRTCFLKYDHGMMNYKLYMK